MKTITADKWTPGMNAYLWEETGNGSLRRVSSISRDWWISTDTGCSASWCCCPDTTLYVFDSDLSRGLMENEMRRQLQERRETWNRKVEACRKQVREAARRFRAKAKETK